MWEADHKEGWTLKNWCFQIVVLEKTLESPLDSQKIKPVKPKGNQHWIFTGKTHAGRCNTLATWCKEPTHCKRPSWERLKAGGEGVDGEPYGWTVSTIWVGAWIWANSGRQWRDRKAWHAAVHGVAKSWTWLNKNKCTCARTHTPITESLCYMSETNTILWINHTSHLKKKSTGHRWMGLFLNSLWVMGSSFPLKPTPFRSGKLSSFSQNGVKVWLPWNPPWSSLFCLWRTSPPVYSQNPEGLNRSAAPVHSSPTLVCFPPWEEEVFIRQLLCLKLMHFHHFALITTQRDSCDYYPHVTDEKTEAPRG